MPTQHVKIQHFAHPTVNIYMLNMSVFSLTGLVRSQKTRFNVCFCESVHKHVHVLRWWTILHTHTLMAVNINLYHMKRSSCTLVYTHTHTDHMRAHRSFFRSCGCMNPAGCCNIETVSVSSWGRRERHDHCLSFIFSHLHRFFIEQRNPVSWSTGIFFLYGETSENGDNILGNSVILQM